MSNMKMDTQGMSMPLDPNDPDYQKKQKESIKNTVENGK